MQASENFSSTQTPTGETILVGLFLLILRSIFDLEALVMDHPLAGQWFTIHHVGKQLSFGYFGLLFA